MTDRFQVIPAAYLYLRREHEVLLQRRSGTGYMDGFWVAGAAGHLEPHETAAGCAVREAAEELGVVVDAAHLEPVTVLQRTDGTDDPVEQRVDWFFTARVWSGRPRVMETSKCAGVAWHSLHDLPVDLPDYERLVLDAIRSGTAPMLMEHGFRAAATGRRRHPA